MNLINLYTAPTLSELIDSDKEFDNLKISQEGIDIQKFKDSIVTQLNRIKRIVKEVFFKLLKAIVAGFQWLFSKITSLIEYLKHFDDKELLESYRRVIMSDLGRPMYILNRDNSLIDLDLLDETVETFNRLLYSGLGKEVVYPPEIDLPSNTPYQIYEGWYIEFDKREFTSDDLKNISINDFKKLFNKSTMRYLEKRVSKHGIPKELETFQNKLNDTRQWESFAVHTEATLIFEYLFKNYKAQLATYSSLLSIYRGVSKQIFNGDMFTEKYKPKGTLYHLSLNDQLADKLYPRQPDSLQKDFKHKWFQILPKRVSFSPSIKGAVYGIPTTLKSNLKLTKDKVKYIDLFVYEAIPDKETRMVKEKYMQQSIFEWNYTHEIAITTPIAIKKVLKIRVYFKDKFKTIRTVFGFDQREWMDVIDRIEELEKYR